MQLISFHSEVGGADCKSAIAPIVYQGSATIAAGTGDTAAVVVDLAAGAAAYQGGQVWVRGCSDVQVDLQYIDGDDCNPCTAPDTLTLVPVSVIVPANSSFPLPEGYWQDLSITAVDSTGTAQNVQTDVRVSIYSAHKPACASCIVLAV